MGDLPRTHLYALHKSLKKGGVCLKRSVRILTKDDCMLVGKFSTLAPNL